MARIEWKLTLESPRVEHSSLIGGPPENDETERHGR